MTRPDLTRSRDRMVTTQIAGRGIVDAGVLDAMRRVPREEFVRPDAEEFAYEDAPLPIEEGQTISQPYIVALMLEAAGVRPGHRVLEVGTGSGYAAAVAAQIGAAVYTIERHALLADSARERLARLGYHNVHVRCGDGTGGWPEAAPFDAILVAAGGPDVPPALRDQLAVGGKLVIPVGTALRDQRLIVVTRTDEDTYEEGDLGGVAFVPLIGEFGWPVAAGNTDDEADAEAKCSRKRTPPARARTLAEHIAHCAEPLPDPDGPAFAAWIDRFADARVVLLGEATHGTAQFYRARAAITQRLIERHGFRIVAVEADWPDAAAIDHYVRHRPGLFPADEPSFTRFPTWMWRNREVESFLDWLRSHNAGRRPAEQTAFYGLDIYNLSASIHAVVGYLDGVDPAAAAAARERYGCLTRWQKDPAVYGRAALTDGYGPCEKPVLTMLAELLRKKLSYSALDGESFLDAAQNARLIASAERYYRVMYYGSRESWNLRDRHMFETLEHVLEHRGARSKAVVWAHNSHVGNASATEMGIVREEINIGQLCRERFGEDAVLVGFGTDRGTVAAASNWDAPMEIMQVRPSHGDSYERLCRDSGVSRFLLDLRRAPSDLRGELRPPRLQRAIGVIYRPDTELLSHYFDTSLPAQFDAWLWFEETTAVTPLPTKVSADVPETYPFGL